MLLLYFFLEGGETLFWLALPFIFFVAAMMCFIIADEDDEDEEDEK